MDASSAPLAAKAMDQGTDVIGAPQSDEVMQECLVPIMATPQAAAHSADVPRVRSAAVHRAKTDDEEDIISFSDKDTEAADS